MKSTNRQVIYFVISLTVALGTMSYTRFAYAEAIKWNLSNTGNIGPGYSTLQPVFGSGVKSTTSASVPSATVNGTIPVWKLVVNPATGKPYDSFLDYIQTPANGVSWDSAKQTKVSDVLNTELSNSSEKSASKDEVLGVLKDLPVSEQNAWLLLALSFGLSVPALQRMLTKVGTSGSVNPNEAKVKANPNAAKLMLLIETNGGFTALGITKDDYFNLVMFGSSNFKDFIDSSSSATAVTLKGLDKYLAASSRTAAEKQAILLKIITGNLTYSADLQGLAAVNMSMPNAQAYADNLVWNVTTAVNQRNNLTSSEVIARMKPELATHVSAAKRAVPAIGTMSSLATATTTQTDILSAAQTIAQAAVQSHTAVIATDYLPPATTIGSKFAVPEYASALTAMLGKDLYDRLGTASGMLRYMYRLADLGSNAPDFDLKGRGVDKEVAVIKPLLDKYRAGLLKKDQTSW